MSAPTLEEAARPIGHFESEALTRRYWLDLDRAAVTHEQIAALYDAGDDGRADELFEEHMLAIERAAKTRALLAAFKREKGA